MLLHHENQENSAQQPPAARLMYGVCCSIATTTTTDANGGMPAAQYNHLEEPALVTEEPLHLFPTVGTADVAIFWDSENVHIPRWCPASRASEGIRNSVAKYGRIVEKRLYFDSKRETPIFPRMELDLSGFTLVDCPSRNRKETLDKKLIVDVLCFAWERASRGAKACVVLITSDGDYSYVLARLRDIGVYTVVMYRPDIVAKVLIDNANVVLSWEYDVLGGPPKAKEDEDNSLVEESAYVGEIRSGEGIGERHIPVDSTSRSHEQNDDDYPVHSTKINDVSHELSILCSVVHEGKNMSSRWMFEGKAAVLYYQKVGSKEKKAYIAIRMEAFERKFIEWGRRNLKDAGKPIVSIPDREHKGTNISTELYVRLTHSGMAVVLKDQSSTKEEVDGLLASSFMMQALVPSPLLSYSSKGNNIDFQPPSPEHIFDTPTGTETEKARTAMSGEINTNARDDSDDRYDYECQVNKSKIHSERESFKGIATECEVKTVEQKDDTGTTGTTIQSKKRECSSIPSLTTGSLYRGTDDGGVSMVLGKKLGHDAGKFAIFCSAVLNGQYATVREGVDVYSSWAPESTIGVAFYEKVGTKDRDGYQAVRSQATQRHFIEWGRRNLSVPGKPIVRVRDRDHREPDLSLETYVRLTFSGLTILNVDIPRKEESDWIPVLPKTHHQHKPQHRSSSHSASDTKSPIPSNASCRLFVGGLAWETTADSKRSYFRQYGPLE